ncbi:MAG: LysM peptidoglycan-binding domain-containing protein [Granulosicoccus sp.]
MVNSVNSSSPTHNSTFGDESTESDLAQHTVSFGDTLSKLARDHGVNIESIIAANPQIANPDLIYPGDIVNIPSSPQYTVSQGDTLSALANRFGTSVDVLVSANNITNPDLIYPGDVLNIPAASPTTTGPVSPAPTTASNDPTPDTITPTGAGSATVPVTTPGTFDYQSIVGVAGNPNVTPAFIQEVEAIAARVGTRPEYLMAVMSFETGGSFSPSVVNETSGATGLIQFIPPTARGLGTSTAALANMSAIEQLQYVEKYFEQYSGKLGTLEGVYTSVLSGRATPDPSATLVTPSGTAFAGNNQTYRQNAGLDLNRDGRITSGEATALVASRLYGGVGSVQQQLINSGVVPVNQQNGFVDNQFGPNTSQALARFQQQAGLPATGLLDDATGRALFNVDGTTTPSPATPSAPAQTGELANVDLSSPIHERNFPGRQTITSPVIGEILITDGYMSRGDVHSSKSEKSAIFSDNPQTVETVPAGRFNLGVDYVTSDGRIRTWFDGVVEDIRFDAGGYGNYIITRTDQSFSYNGQEYPVFAHYAHANGFNVAEGTRISAGQDIGEQGSTGGSTGPHVDFLTWIEVNGSRIFISPNLLVTHGD